MARASNGRSRWSLVPAGSFWGAMLPQPPSSTPRCETPEGYSTRWSKPVTFVTHESSAEGEVVVGAVGLLKRARHRRNLTSTRGHRACAQTVSGPGMRSRSPVTVRTQARERASEIHSPLGILGSTRSLLALRSTSDHPKAR